MRKLALIFGLLTAALLVPSARASVAVVGTPQINTCSSSPASCAVTVSETAGNFVLASCKSSFSVTAQYEFISSSIGANNQVMYVAFPPHETTDGTNFYVMQAWYIKSVAGGSDTFTCTKPAAATPHSITAEEIELSGVAGTAVNLQDSFPPITASGTSTAPASGSFTTTGSSDFLIGLLLTNGSPTITHGTGWTIATSGANAAMEYQLNVGVAGYNAQFTLGTSEPWQSAIIAFSSTDLGGFKRPSCGYVDQSQPMLPTDWATYTGPISVGGYFMDMYSGCVITRISNSASGECVEGGKNDFVDIHYSLSEAINTNDAFVKTGSGTTGGCNQIKTLQGAVVVPKSNYTATPHNHDAEVIWDGTNPNVFYYTNGANIMSATITGTPGCLSTNSCTMTTAVFDSTCGGVASCNAIEFPGDMDVAPDGIHVAVTFTTTANTQIRFGEYNFSTKTMADIYVTTTTPCQIANLGSSSQPACLHREQTSPDNRPIVDLSQGSVSPETGRNIIGTFASPTNGTLNSIFNTGCCHSAPGWDPTGTIPLYADVGYNTPVCWTGVGGGTGGFATVRLDTFAASCAYGDHRPSSDDHTAVGWSGPNQPYAEVDYETQVAGPYNYNSDAAYGAAVPVQTPNPGVSFTTNGWYDDSEAVLLYPINDTGNVNTRGGSTPAIVLGSVRSRVNAMGTGSDEYDSQPKCDPARDMNFIVCMSNMPYNQAGCPGGSASWNGSCADVFTVQGAVVGEPLFPASPSGSPAVSFSPTSLSFGNQIVSTTSAQQIVTLTNTGGATLTISSVALTTGTQFALVTPGSGSDCRTVGSVAASASCNIAVTFTPMSTGAQSDTVSVTDNASGSPQTFGVSGTGVLAALSAPAIVMFAERMGAR